MTSVTAALSRWHAAEAEVHDANIDLLLFIQHPEFLDQPEKKKRLKQLRAKASTCLREYLDEVAREANRLASIHSAPRVPKP